MCLHRLLITLSRMEAPRLSFTLTNILVLVSSQKDPTYSDILICK
ncbi:hypothetical protein Golob_007705 [Gossypium lobatum]|uniref:Uncharacterized protein n=1 Tax=Gossypium lobatum TaxID=34289 RepID=A0A7J8MDL7_9ROSI|nr:hypothetical protein [Gossypium lobatum]